MRYNLRTLLILLAVLPPMLAGAWWFVTANPIPALLLSIGYGPISALVTFSWLWEKWRGRPSSRTNT